MTIFETILVVFLFVTHVLEYHMAEYWRSLAKFWQDRAEKSTYERDLFIEVAMAHIIEQCVTEERYELAERCKKILIEIKEKRESLEKNKHN